MNKRTKTSRDVGNWIGVGTAIGAAVFAATNEPVWIAVGVAIGAAIGWRKPKDKNDQQPQWTPNKTWRAFLEEEGPA